MHPVYNLSYLFCLTEMPVKTVTDVQSFFFFFF